MNWILTLVSGYLIGSLNFAIIVSKLYMKQDIRSFGSGNAGSTNVYRTMGWKPTLVVMVGDIMKGLLGVWIGEMLLGDIGKMLAGVALIAGHIFPIYFGFKGGKGILTTAAIMAMVDWRVCAIALSLFLIIVAVTRYVSLGSICAACLVPPAVALFHHDNIGYILLSCLITLILVVKHWENIGRLRNGTENKFSFKSKETPPEADPENQKQPH